MTEAKEGRKLFFKDIHSGKNIDINKSLGGFHLARQNLMELTGLDLMCIDHDDQAVTGNQGYFEDCELNGTE